MPKVLDTPEGLERRDLTRDEFREAMRLREVLSGHLEGTDYSVVMASLAMLISNIALQATLNEDGTADREAAERYIRVLRFNVEDALRASEVIVMRAN